MCHKKIPQKVSLFFNFVPLKLRETKKKKRRQLNFLLLLVLVLLSLFYFFTFAVFEPLGFLFFYFFSIQININQNFSVIKFLQKFFVLTKSNSIKKLISITNLTNHPTLTHITTSTLHSFLLFIHSTKCHIHPSPLPSSFTILVWRAFIKFKEISLSFSLTPFTFFFFYNT